ncbi:hypothetical protein [Marinobacter sp. C2H3]|uniref:hypothetical protein n=1 Tax=Marinobacter sp. C2H3 TaxID=3119003 RepID=UPI00300F42F3
MSVIFRVALLLLCMGVVSSPVLAEPSMRELAESLNQRLVLAPDSLQWRLPNKVERLTSAEMGVKSGDCDRPMPARTGEAPRFLVRCVVVEYIDMSVTAIQLVSSWTYKDGKWGTGQVVSIRDVSRLAFEQVEKDRRRYGGADYASAKPRFSIVWHNGDERGPYEKMFTYMSGAVRDELSSFWRSRPFDESPSFDALKQWRSLTWPSGVIGIRRDGQLLLQAGSVAGTTPLLKHMTTSGALPDFAEGLIRPVKMRQYWEAEVLPGDAMYLLKMFRANHILYALALSDRQPSDFQEGVEILSSTPEFTLVFFAVERNL